MPTRSERRSLRYAPGFEPNVVTQSQHVGCVRCPLYAQLPDRVYVLDGNSLCLEHFSRERY